jgi:hypothetical protein
MYKKFLARKNGNTAEKTYKQITKIYTSLKIIAKHIKNLQLHDLMLYIAQVTESYTAKDNTKNLQNKQVTNTMLREQKLMKHDLFRSGYHS